MSNSRSWQKSKLPGVQYRADKSRPRVQSEEGGPSRYDRYYRGRLKVGGKLMVFSFGWTSEFKELTEKFVYDRIRIYKANILAGKSPQSWKEELELSRNALERSKQREEAESVILGQVVQSYIRNRKLKPLTVRDINHHLNSSFSSWKDSSIKLITRESVRKKFKELSDNSPSQANQAFRVLRALLNYARATYRLDDAPILPENPVQVLSDARLWHNVSPKSRRIPLDKVGVVWNFLQKVRKDPERSFNIKLYADVAAFAMLTGARKAEVTELEWDRVNMEAMTWFLPDPKNHNPVTFPLSEQARAIIEQRPKINEYVFANFHSKSGHACKPINIMRELLEATGVKISMHDLRRTFTAIAAECGIELWKTKLLLNHKMKHDVTINNYTQTDDLRYLQPEIQKIGDWIETNAEVSSAKENENKTAKHQNGKGKVLSLENVRRQCA